MNEVRLDLFKLCDEKQKTVIGKIPAGLQKELILHLERTKTNYLKRMQDYQKAISLHSKGLGANKITKILPYPRSTIEGWIYRGMKPTHKPEITKIIVQKLKFEINLTNREIAKIVGIKPKSVYYGYIRLGRKEGKKFLPSKTLIELIKSSQNPTEFLNYFWRETSPQELENFEKFCKFIKLKDKIPPFKLARVIGKSYSTVFKWRKNKCAPNLLRWVDLYIKLGRPKKNHVWLFISLGLNGVPIGQPIEVLKYVTSWQDIKNVIDQLKSLDNNETLISGMSKEECFGFVLGIIVGDSSKHGKNKDSIHLHLSKDYETNKLLGNFFCSNLGKLGLKANRIKDGENTYNWVSQSSPLFNWIYQAVLGLKINETMTACSIKANWLLYAPLKVRKRFLQGIFESDGSVSYEGGITCACFPNNDLIQNLLKYFGVKSYVTNLRKWKLLELGGLQQLKKLHKIPFVPEIKTKRYQVIEKIVEANKVKGTGGRLPLEIRKEIKDMISKEFKTYKIIKRILFNYNFFTTRSTVEYYKRKILKMKGGDKCLKKK